MHIKSISTHLKTICPVGNITLEHMPESNTFNIFLENSNVSITGVTIDAKTAKQISEFIRNELKVDKNYK